MAYQQLHAGKVKLNGISGIQHHMLDRNRVKTNPNIDLSHSALNHSIEELTAEHLAKRVHQRIKNLHLKRKPRFDAVAIEDIIIGASSVFMLHLDIEKREQYFADSLHFFQNRYGKENVMYCQCHLDEANPHIHIGIIPVTSDGRLSARDVFNPKSLEKLQTDFHLAVSSRYGLERGEHHAHHYLELNKFKLQQTQQQLLSLSEDLNTAILLKDNIQRIQQSVHFHSFGTFFKSLDKENVVLPTSDFLTLTQMAENGVTVSSAFQLLQQQNLSLQQEKSKALADYNFLFQKFQHLQNISKPYTQIPSSWRKNIDNDIYNWQKTFINYCHDLHRATVRVFISTHGDYHKTANIMQPLLEHISISDSKNYVHNIISSALTQYHSNFQPPDFLPSWHSPKPSETDYKKADETGIVPLQLSTVPDINWNIINWDLLAAFAKDSLRSKQLSRSI